MIFLFHERMLPTRPIKCFYNSDKFSHPKVYFLLFHPFQKSISRVQFNSLTIPIAHNVLKPLRPGCIQPLTTQTLLFLWHPPPDTCLLDTRLPDKSLPRTKNPWSIPGQIHQCLSLVLCHASHLAQGLGGLAQEVWSNRVDCTE